MVNKNNMNIVRTNLDEDTILNKMKEINKYNRHNWRGICHYYDNVFYCEGLYHSSVCDKAASCGHLKILKWAHVNGCPIKHSICENAAYNGHLEVLKYAHENGCPWNEWTCSNAAENGHLEVLYYLYENEAPYAIYGGVHESCKEFFDIYGEYWKKGDFSLMHNLKPAKNK